MRSSSNRKSFLVISLSCIILFLFIVAWLNNGKPVLVEWYYGIKYGSICDPPLIIRNPLRNRDSEKVADAFLESIKAGNYQKLDEIISDKDRLEQIKDGESNAKIKSWFAGNRSTEGNKTILTYWVDRNYDGGCLAVPTGVEVENSNGVWKVVNYNPIY